MQDEQLEEAYLKWCRAKEHLDTLKSEIATYNVSKPFGFMPVIENGVLIAKVHPFNPPPPYGRYVLIIGDCVTNSRAALDYIAWQFAMKWTGSALTENVARTISFSNTGALRGLSNCDVSVVACIEQFKNDLWFRDLEHLVRFDKHRTLRLTAPEMKNGKPWSIEVDRKHIPIQGPVARIPVPARPMVGGMTDGAFYLELVFQEAPPSGQSVAPSVLTSILQGVEDVLRAFEHSF
jgi:hypothetical protein